MTWRQLPALLVPLLLTWLSVASSAATQSYPVSGVVLDSTSGQPLPRFAITLTSDKGGAGQTVPSGAQGQFSFPAVPPGKYILSGSGPGYRAQGLNQHDSYFTGVAVGPKLDATNIVFRMQQDASIRGQVVDEQNEPVRNATAQLFRIDEVDGMRRPVSVTNDGTNDQGFYRFAHLRPGTYYVALSARPWYAQYQPQSAERRTVHGDRYQPPQLDPDTATRVQQEETELNVTYPLTFYPDADDSSQASAITLHPGERFTADVVMRAVPALHLKIHYDQARHGPGPTIMQRVFDGLTIPVFASQGYGFGQGIFEFAGLAPGHYTLELQGGGADKSGRSGWYRDVDVYGDIDVTASESPGMANVMGLVTYEEGSLPTRETPYIELRNVETGDSWTDRISDKGLFGLKDNELRPGTYQAVLYGAPEWILTRIVAQNAKVQGTQITLTAGASAKLACTATRVSTNLTGTVMRDDKPIPGAMVLLVPDDGTRDQQRYRRDESDSDGTFSLRQVLPGRYTAVAILNGWNLEWGDPAVLMPYLAKGEKVVITADKTPNLTLQVQ